MKWNAKVRVLATLLMVMGLLVLTVPAIDAQEQQQSMLTDPRMVVIPTRTVDEINNDMENARAGKQLADYRRTRAEYRLQQVDGTIESHKVTLGDIDRRKGEAKKAKKETEVMALEIEKKANRQAIDLLDKLKDLRKSEVEEAKTDAELTEIDLSALQLETELVRKRAEYDSLYMAGAGDLTLTTSQQVLRELEVRLLKLQQQRAEATQKLASKQKDIVSRRMKLHQAQLKLGMPR